jgi:hypothetical protein
MLRTRAYPGRVPRDEWLRLSIQQRCLLVARAQSDLLELWQSCRKKPCRRARACQGDDKCRLKPLQADLNNPNLGQPGFRFSYRLPDELRVPTAILDQLPYLIEPPTPEAILQDCAAEADAKAEAALRRAFPNARRRKKRDLVNE